MGRPSKFTEQYINRLIEAYETFGATDKVACEYAGICTETFKSWKRQAQQDREAGNDTEYTAFFERIKKAQQSARLIWLAGIINAGDKQWTAYAWLLERLDPETYGNKLKHSGNIEHEVIGKIVVQNAEDKD